MAFAGELRQSTAVDVLIGPFVEDSDGDTPTTGLTLDVELSKNGQALANKNDATAPVHDGAGTVAGYYNCELDATDTGTLGNLTLVVHHADALPIRLDYSVVTANYWDSKYSTDKLEVDLIQMGGVAQSATDLKDFADAGYDPATNKITGVVLADTCTTNTDLVSAADVVNEWETQSQADPTGFHVNLMETNGTAQTAGDLAALLVDIPTVAEFNARSLVSADYVVTTDTIAGVTTVTNLTNAPTAGDLTATMKASVQTEVDTALGTYDAPTNAEMVAAFTEIKGATWAAGTDTLEHIRNKQTDIETDIADVPTVAEFNARTIPSADYVVTTDTIAGVTLVGTCTTNTDLVSAADIMGTEVDNDGTAISLEGAMKLLLSAASGEVSGAGTTTVTIRDIADSKDRIVATVDPDGNRTAIGTRDAT